MLPTVSTVSDCGICHLPLLAMNQKEHILDTQCTPTPHLYHYFCLNQWLTEHETCPLEKRVLSEIIDRNTQEKLSISVIRCRNNMMKMCAESGDINSIKDMVSRGADINAGASDNADKPLHIAASNKQKVIVEFLVSQQAKQTSATLRLARKYAIGLGLPQDYTKARQLYVLAAGQGNASAQCSLGFLLENELGGEKDDTLARKFYALAAEQGDASAQCNLGILWEQGRGGEQDYTKARKFYALAAKQGDASAQYNLGLLLKNGQGGEPDYTKARQFFALAAGQGNASAQYNLALLLEHGSGGEQDYTIAREFYARAAELGNASAQYNLGVLWANGLGGEQNDNQSRHFFNLAAEQGDEDALIRIFEMIESE